jgi:ADP-ribose pyrophosphatase YjhB (NUDIX family)
MKTVLVEGYERDKCRDCGFLHYQNPKPGVVVQIRRGDSVLLGKRRGTVAFGKWCLPGGFINFEEDYLTAAHREIREETGLEIEITGIISVVSNFFLPEMHTLVVVLSGVPAGGELRAGDDLGEVDWFPLEGPLPPLAFESDAHILERTAAGDAAPTPIDPRFKIVREDKV